MVPSLKQTTSAFIRRDKVASCDLSPGRLQDNVASLSESVTCRTVTTLKQLMSVVDVFQHACRQMVDILSSRYHSVDIHSVISQETFDFVRYNIYKRYLFCNFQRI